jgi:hypothetical protein
MRLRLRRQCDKNKQLYSQRFLSNANSAIFQLYHGGNKVIVKVHRLKLVMNFKLFKKKLMMQKHSVSKNIDIKCQSVS